MSISTTNMMKGIAAGRPLAAVETDVALFKGSATEGAPVSPVMPPADPHHDSMR
jgi:hypothetical protein